MSSVSEHSKCTNQEAAPFEWTQIKVNAKTFTGKCANLFKWILGVSRWNAKYEPVTYVGMSCRFDNNAEPERLEQYAGPGHGMVKIDNNWAENAMRGVALGRKNWI